MAGLPLSRAAEAVKQLQDWEHDWYPDVQSRVQVATACTREEAGHTLLYAGAAEGEVHATLSVAY